MNPFTQVKSESREKKYQILINFSKLKELQADFLLKLTEENLYYDENGLLYLKIEIFMDVEKSRMIHIF